MQMASVRMAFAALALLVPAVALAAQDILVHRDPGCPCCAKWVELVRREFGRPVEMVDDANRAVLPTRFGMPANLSSCHTAIIDGLVFEGHVPIADMKRALAQRPKGVRGLAVPGMPIGSPGMEAPGRPAQHYTVTAFGPGGTKVYAQH